MYWLQTAAIKMNREISKYIGIRIGVRQGCILSPELFNLLSENIFQDITAVYKRCKEWEPINKR